MDLQGVGLLFEGVGHEAERLSDLAARERHAAARLELHGRDRFASRDQGDHLDRAGRDERETHWVPPVAAPALLRGAQRTASPHGPYQYGGIPRVPA